MSPVSPAMTGGFFTTGLPEKPFLIFVSIFRIKDGISLVNEWILTSRSNLKETQTHWNQSGIWQGLQWERWPPWEEIITEFSKPLPFWKLGPEKQSLCHSDALWVFSSIQPAISLTQSPLTGWLFLLGPSPIPSSPLTGLWGVTQDPVT